MTRRTLLRPLLPLAALTIGLLPLTTAHAADPTHYLFVGDLKTGTLLR